MTTTAAVISECCGCCKVTECLSGDTIDTDCCLSCDELLMWSERPSFEIVQKYYLRAPGDGSDPDCPAVPGTGGNPIGKIVHYKTSTQELEPVQTLYSFYETYWRPLSFYGSSIVDELPVKKDPICPPLDSGSSKLLRCRYDFADAEKMRWWDSSTTQRLTTCLHMESPCAVNGCASIPPDPSVNPCAGEESITSCGTFVLTPNDIIEDLKRGYSTSSQGNSGDNCCYPIIEPPCIRVIADPMCECNSPWMTNYRRRKLLDDYRTIWGVDVECYDENNTTAFSLTNQWLFNMTFERWWKISKDNTDGLTQSFWNVPEQSGVHPNPTFNNTAYPYQVDDLVPKYWIFACSAVPFFLFELNDAVSPMNTLSSTPRTPVISAQDATDILDYKRNDTPYAEYLLQSIFESLSNGGYFESKDWRAEQLQAYKELAVRFPGQGYETYANKTVAQMPLLGPFRKRYYDSHILGRVHPILRPDLVPDSAKSIQVEFYHQYPGQFPNKSMTDAQKQQAIDDYYFWAERQWVYFRGAPAGWTWASWDSGTTCPCCVDFYGVSPNEDQAILAGCGRAKGNCIESWFNAPQITTIENIPTSNVYINYEGFGQPEGSCIVDDFGEQGPLSECNCCHLRCDFQFPGTGDPGSQPCHNNCMMGVCRVEIPIDPCGVTEETISSTTGTGAQTSACGCGATPVQGCLDDDCRSLSVNAYCGGVHIIATQYATENFTRKLPNGCGTAFEDVSSFYRCLWTANTFLTPAKNSFRYNNTKERCIKTTDTHMFNTWPTVRNTHIVPESAICNPHIVAINQVCPDFTANASDYQYLMVPACESGICWPWTVLVDCCGSACIPDQKVNCLQRIQCVPVVHGKQWDARNVCPPSCGTDDPSYGTYPSDYYGRDGIAGFPTESSCERDNYLGYTPECG